MFSFLGAGLVHLLLAHPADEYKDLAEQKYILAQ